MRGPPHYLEDLLGWRDSKVPNIADAESDASVAIGAEILSLLGIGPGRERGTPGVDVLKKGFAGWLTEQLGPQSPERSLVVETGQPVSKYAQYAHLAELSEIGRSNPVVSAELGFDFELRPDVVVELTHVSGRRIDPVLLHAAAYCRWTIRSDRVQSLRREGLMFSRHRRGRQPHICVVTAEPLPSRLAAIARGTGEIDQVFHLMFDELLVATNRVATPAQRDVIAELVEQRRLRGVRDIRPTLLT